MWDLGLLYTFTRFMRRNRCLKVQGRMEVKEDVHQLNRNQEKPTNLGSQNRDIKL